MAAPFAAPGEVGRLVGCEVGGEVLAHAGGEVAVGWGRGHVDGFGGVEAAEDFCGGGEGIGGCLVS